MGSLYIAEFDSITPTLEGGAIHAARQPPIVEQKLPINATSTCSAVFNTATRFVMLRADAICSVKFGAGPTQTASASNMRFAANDAAYFGVTPGFTVAAITNT